jgi:hypothetical protein
MGYATILGQAASRNNRAADTKNYAAPAGRFAAREVDLRRCDYQPAMNAVNADGLSAFIGVHPRPYRY